MTLTLPRPPQVADKGLERHLLRVQLLLEQADRENMKRADVAERTNRSIATYTTSTTIGQGQDVVLADATSGAVTITLPPAAERFKEYTIKKMDASGNAVIIDGSGAETIDGATTVSMTTQYETRTIASNGTQWVIL